jgi:uncharacterized delta-60 repeat protein
MKIKKIAVVLLTILAVASISYSQGVDPGYNPKAALPSQTSTVEILPLPDGRLLTFVITDIATVIRINEDGSVDESFHCACEGMFVYSMALQPDGKYLIAGSAGSDPNIPDIIRVNTDGTRDLTFTSPFQGSANFAEVYGVTPEGKIYALVQVQTGSRLYRLNSDGSIDDSFISILFNGLGFFGEVKITAVVLLPNGQLYITGAGLQPGPVFRVNVDGSIDNGFNQPVFLPNSGGLGAVAIGGVVPQADGKIVISGNFNKVNGLTRNNIARLNADGSVDSATASTTYFQTQVAIQPQSDGKIIVIYSGGLVIRLNPDLSNDATYTSWIGGSYYIVDSEDRVLHFFGTILRRNTDGTPDNTFDLKLFVPGDINDVAIQSDGKAIIAGEFASLNGVTKSRFARLNLDGSIDGTFTTGAGFTRTNGTADITKIVIEPSGKILVLGDFEAYNGTPVSRLVRLNPNGSLDASLGANLTGMASIGVQPDGKILLYGASMGVNGFARTMVARINSDGATDTAFNPQVPSATFRDALLQPDGKIVFGGTFSTVNGTSRPNLARINSDGSLDTSFNAGSIASVRRIALHIDGKFTVAPDTGNAILRLSSTGAADPGFSSPSINASSVNVILPEPGGSVIIGGSFITPQSGILRLRRDGSYDAGFVVPGVSGIVRDLAKQPDRKIVVAGKYRSIGGAYRYSLARLNGRPIQYDFDGDGRADFAVTRPSDYNWHVLTNGPLVYTATPFGSAGDRVVPGDYDGDGKTDFAVWRPSTGDWFWKESSTGNVLSRNLGTSADTPLPSDVDGDGKTDLIVISPGLAWKGMKAATGELIVLHQFGQAGDKPVIGDFDGDGKGDLAYYRPSNGTWYYNKSSSGANLEVGSVQWGISSDVPVPADYDGDGMTDVGVFRPSEGNWYVLLSNGGFIMLHFGATGDKPIPADYDGDGRTDIAVYRPSEGFWYMLLSTGGYTGLPWGISTDIPIPNALIP